MTSQQRDDTDWSQPFDDRQARTQRAANAVLPEQWVTLIDAIQSILREAIVQGGTTLQDFTQASWQQIDQRLQIDRRAVGRDRGRRY